MITGASGNVGSALVERLAHEPRVESLVGLCRRRPEWSPPKTTWTEADIATDDLTSVFADADAVVHLAWLFQPTHRPDITWQANVLGSMRVFEAAAGAKVPALIHASSVGAYSPRSSLDRVDESWPTHGWPQAAYSREKSYLERVLDHHQATHPSQRVVRMRPAFIFQRRSAEEQRRIFIGPFLPNTVVRPGLVPVLPEPAGMRLQTLHSEDAADAYARAVLQPVSGAFNLAAEPVLDLPAVARSLQARTVKVPAGLLRTGLAAAWHAHLAPASPELFDLAMRIPMMSSRAARDELGWTPQHSASDAIEAFLGGLRSKQTGATPPLGPSTTGRTGELGSGVGERP